MPGSARRMDDTIEGDPINEGSKTNGNEWPGAAGTPVLGEWSGGPT